MKNEDGKAVPAGKKTLMPTKLDDKLQEEVDQRKRERDVRSLFFKNVPKSTPDEKIKALSADIISVQRKFPTDRWGWLMFANEKVCQKNLEKIKGAKIGDHEIFVDLCTNKRPNEAKEHLVDALKLYVGNIPRSTKEDDLKRLFPTASKIYSRSDKTFAFIAYDTPESARKAFESSKGANIEGTKITVCFAKALENTGRPFKKYNKNKANPKKGGKRE